MRKTNPNFLNGVPEMLVLELLSQQEMYGYELVRAIQEKTKERLTFGEGCIYPLLHWLEETKLVISRRQEVEGRSRNYYQVTPKGRKRLEELENEWKEVVAGVSLVLGGQHA
jgi:PadR family transcriptional regulator, regulatory protein PadR